MEASVNRFYKALSLVNPSITFPGPVLFVIKTIEIFMKFCILYIVSVFRQGDLTL